MSASFSDAELRNASESRTAASQLLSRLTTISSAPRGSGFRYASHIGNTSHSCDTSDEYDLDSTTDSNADAGRAHVFQAPVTSPQSPHKTPSIRAGSPSRRPHSTTPQSTSTPSSSSLSHRSAGTSSRSSAPQPASSLPLVSSSTPPPSVSKASASRLQATDKGISTAYFDHVVLVHDAHSAMNVRAKRSALTFYMDPPKPKSMEYRNLPDFRPVAYHLLSRETTRNLLASLQIPDTVFIDNGSPQAYYSLELNSRCVRLARRPQEWLSSESVFSRFSSSPGLALSESSEKDKMKRKPDAKSQAWTAASQSSQSESLQKAKTKRGSCVAMYVSTMQYADGKHESSVQYLDATQLQNFLSFPRKGFRGLLLSHIEASPTLPRMDSEDMYLLKVRWFREMTLVERVDTLNISSRADLPVGSSDYATSKIARNCDSLCKQVVAHFQRVVNIASTRSASSPTILISRMVCFMTIDASEKPVLLWFDGIRTINGKSTDFRERIDLSPFETVVLRSSVNAGRSSTGLSALDPATFLQQSAKTMVIPSLQHPLRGPTHGRSPFSDDGLELHSCSCCDKMVSLLLPCTHNPFLFCFSEDTSPLAKFLYYRTHLRKARQAELRQAELNYFSNGDVLHADGDDPSSFAKMATSQRYKWIIQEGSAGIRSSQSSGVFCNAKPFPDFSSKSNPQRDDAAVSPPRVRFAAEEGVDDSLPGKSVPQSTESAKFLGVYPPDIAKLLLEDDDPKQSSSTHATPSHSRFNSEDIGAGSASKLPGEQNDVEEFFHEHEMDLPVDILDPDFLMVCQDCLIRIQDAFVLDLHSEGLYDTSPQSGTDPFAGLYSPYTLHALGLSPASFSSTNSMDRSLRKGSMRSQNKSPKPDRLDQALTTPAVGRFMGPQYTDATKPSRKDFLGQFTRGKQEDERRQQGVSSISKVDRELSEPLRSLPGKSSTQPTVIRLEVGFRRTRSGNLKVWKKNDIRTPGMSSKKQASTGQCAEDLAVAQDNHVRILETVKRLRRIREGRNGRQTGVARQDSNAEDAGSVSPANDKVSPTSERVAADLSAGPSTTTRDDSPSDVPLQTLGDAPKVAQDASQTEPASSAPANESEISSTEGSACAIDKPAADECSKNTRNPACGDDNTVHDPVVGDQAQTSPVLSPRSDVSFSDSGGDDDDGDSEHCKWGEQRPVATLSPETTADDQRSCARKDSTNSTMSVTSFDAFIPEVDEV
eukprot:ANDGO_05645.mRNA.1 hypothetical protein